MKRIMSASAFFIILVLGTFVYALGYPLPDTGQTKCYNNTVEIICPQPGENFYGQDGNYLINPPSYTKLDAEGNGLQDSATEWVMVRDNVTGLIWEVKTDDGSVHDKDKTFPWQIADDFFIVELNSSNFGGFSDWRLPTITELSSIADYGRHIPAANTTYFPNMVSQLCYWSSTTYASRPDEAWFMYFNTAYDAYGIKSASHLVRAVRGQHTENSFIDNGNGTVTDASTGLMWQQATGGWMIWEAALLYIENLSLGGYTDWRLPNIKELRSIVDRGTYLPAIDTDYFPDTQSSISSFYWSSTSRVDQAPIAWVLKYTFGYDSYYNKANTYYYVRSLRGGQNYILGRLFITSPNQASHWTVGSSMSILWNTQDIPGNVKISISRQGGKDGTFETIAENTENNGTYNWTVTGTATVNCVLKIEPINDTSKGTTQGLFTIYNVPAVSTGSATSVTTNSATLNGTVNPNASSTTYYFEYGTTTSYGSTTTSTSAGIGTSDVSAYASLTGLISNATYHFRLVATNSAGTSYGDDHTFTTPAIAPTTTTGSATSLASTSATLNGTVNANGASTTVIFEYGTDTS